MQVKIKGRWIRFTKNLYLYFIGALSLSPLAYFLFPWNLGHLLIFYQFSLFLMMVGDAIAPKRDKTLTLMFCLLPISLAIFKSPPVTLTLHLVYISLLGFWIWTTLEKILKKYK